MRAVVKVAATYLAHFFAACRVVRAQFVVSVFAFIALSLPPQTREVYRVLADDFPNQQWQIALGFLSLLAASGFIWHCGRQATLLERQSEMQQSSIEAQMLRWMPRVLAALVPLGTALGLHTTIREAETTAQLVHSVAAKEDWPELAGVYGLIDASPARLWVGTVIALGLAALVILVTTLRTRGKSESYAGENRWLIGEETTICSGMIALTCVAMFSLAPPWLAQTIGVMAIFGLFLIVVVVVLSTLLLWGDKLGVPLIWILVGATLVLTALDWNDNHQVEIVAHKREEARPTELAGTFGQWLKTRGDLDYYAKADEPYPVFVVAAAGGGAYAAHYTATFLARMQDSCPNFAQHVFAISGVSGGSIGASLFAGLAKLKAKNQPYVGCSLEPFNRYFEKRTQKFFEQDFLSPVIAGALFPDLIQRLLPIPIGRFDRSRALDASLEAAWQDMVADAATEDPMVAGAANPFKNPFLDLWSPQGGDEAVPALVLNTTEVANGYRIVISPIQTGAMASMHWSKLALLHPLLPRGEDADTVPDIKLSTAAGISARFPWVLPPATVATDGSMKRMRLVDGGYVEGSGVDVASQLVKALKAVVDRTKRTAEPVNAKFYLIALMGYEGTPVEDPSLGEAPLPLRALISTWQTRAEIAFLGAFLDACPEIATCLQSAAAETSYRRALVELPVIPIFLNLRDFQLPLTWQLTQASRQIISLHAGAASRCKRDDTLMMTWPQKAGPYDRIVKALGENSCSLCTMQFRLSHRSESPEWAEDRICTRSPGAASTATSAIGR
ncbi:MAG TPA: hypothetical protein VH852_03715 [Hyphomicrobium sp.]|jgi:hypothetical protein